MMILHILHISNFLLHRIHNNQWFRFKAFEVHGVKLYSIKYME